MHIAIDCRLGGLAHAGIGRYITHLVRELVAQASSDTRWSLICNSRAQAREVLGTQQRRTSVTVVLIKARHYTIREQFELLTVLLRLRPDILHVPHFNAPVGYWGTTVVTIHDLLWHEMRGSAVTTLPAWQYWAKYGFYKLVTKRAVHHASAILVPTKSVQKTVATFYPSVEAKIRVTPEGVSKNFLAKSVHPFSWNTRKQAGLLYVGSLYPHKNIDLVLQALLQMPDVTLTLVGTRSAFVQSVTAQIQHLGLGNRVFHIGSVTDAQLARLYSRCTALVQPSKSEGFGLTGIEAMASGAPVMCSNIPVFREVYGQHALYFDPYSVHSFIAAYKQLSLPRTEKLVQKAHTYAHTFSWQETAQQTLAVYASLAAH